MSRCRPAYWRLWFAWEVEATLIASEVGGVWRLWKQVGKSLNQTFVVIILLVFLDFICLFFIFHLLKITKQNKWELFVWIYQASPLWNKVAALILPLCCYSTSFVNSAAHLWIVMLHHRRLKHLREALLFIESQLLMFFFNFLHRGSSFHIICLKRWWLSFVCVFCCKCYTLGTNILEQSEDIVGKAKDKVRGLVGMYGVSWDV